MDRDWETAQDRLLSAQWRGAKESVIIDSAYAMPRIMSDTSEITNAIVQVATQYMKHPIMSYNYLLKNGIQDRDARSLAASAYSFGLLGFGWYMREQLMIELGILDESDRKYDLDDEEGIQQLTYDIFTRVPQLAYLPRVIEAPLYSVGEPIPGTDITPLDPYSAPIIGTVKQAGKALVETKEEERVSPRWLKFMPIVNSHPLTEELLKKTREEIE